MQTKLKFSCKNCSAQDKQVRGCFTKSKAPVMAAGLKGSVNRCPVIDYFEAGEYLRIYRYWKEGQYPNSGTWAQQPHKLVRIMETIDGIVSEST